MAWLEKLDLEPLLVASIQLKSGVDIGTGPFGRRSVVEIDSGTFRFVTTSDFAGVEGEIMPGASDHALFGLDERTVLIDVRGVMKTNAPPGIHIAVRYQNYVPLDAQTLRNLAADGNLSFARSKFITQPRFEVGQLDGTQRNHGFDFARLMRTPIVAHGALSRRRIEYRMYEVVNRTAG